jgi:hypothetical protein
MFWGETFRDRLLSREIVPDLIGLSMRRYSVLFIFLTTQRYIAVRFDLVRFRVISNCCDFIEFG